MTRKDYKAIAEILNNFNKVIDNEIFEDLTNEFSKMLKLENSNFNNNKFKSACGI